MYYRLVSWITCNFSKRSVHSIMEERTIVQLALVFFFFFLTNGYSTLESFMSNPRYSLHCSVCQMRDKQSIVSVYSLYYPPSVCYAICCSEITITSSINNHRTQHAMQWLFMQSYGPNTTCQRPAVICEDVSA